jgi:ribose 5-phosphate isomerase A
MSAHCSTGANGVTDPHALEKQNAAKRAVDLVQPGMVVGLGTGSTAGLVIEELGRRIERQIVTGVLGVATSRAAERHAVACGIPLTTLDAHPEVDITIDGADEVDRLGHLLKGAGGALLWERIVADCSRRLVIVVDPSKLVSRLGTRRPLPIEVVAFGWSTHLAAIRGLGGEPTLRMDGRAAPYRTDEGHYLIDAWFPGGISDPELVVGTLRSRPGVVETGLFLDLSPEVIVGRSTSSE